MAGPAALVPLAKSDMLVLRFSKDATGKACRRSLLDHPVETLR
jgi:hypothetical protein